jgi:2-octaprenyl-6-methoxyphenol hydroxylase
MNTQTDIIISGGGMVGMSMAIAAARLGLAVTVIEKYALPAQLEAAFDGRVSAIAHGSSLILDSIGAWEGMYAHAEPILDIRVSDGKSPFFVHYDHKEVGKPFGYIVENRYIRHSLQQAAALYPKLSIRENTSILTCKTDADHIEATLTNGDILTAQLVLATDGKNSVLREQFHIPTLKSDYEQTAIVCTIAHEKSHYGLAQERFLPAGPFAVLPLSNNRSSLVWVEPNDRVSLYLELDEENFVQEISERVGDYLGKITTEGERFSYPLSLVHAIHYTKSRFALMGDAAHGMHPIAGQGVNMGFRDVGVMEELLRKQLENGSDIGAQDMLAHYERWRRFDNVAMLGVTHGLNHLFCSSLIPIKTARGLGLWAVQRMPALKRLFMQHAMGMVGDLPERIRKRA